MMRRNKESLTTSMCGGWSKAVHHARGAFVLALALELAACAVWADASVTWAGCWDPFWASSENWGLERPCYPTAGSCVIPFGPPEPRWHVTLVPAGCAPGTTPWLDADVDIVELTIVNGGNMGGSGRHDLTVEETMTWIGDPATGNMLDGLGRILSLGTLTMNGERAGLATRRELINYGTATLTGSLTISGEEGLLNNTAGGLLELRGSGEILGRMFTNDGDVHKRDLGLFTIGSLFNNSSSAYVDIQAGTLRIAHGGPCSGTFGVAPGATLEFFIPFADPLSLDANTSVGGEGTILVSRHAVDSRANWIFDGTTAVSSGSLNFLLPATTRRAVLTGGRITGDLVIQERLSWEDGAMGEPGNTVLQGDANITTGGPEGGPRLENRQLNLSPGHTVNLLTQFGGVAAVINNPVGATFNMGASMGRQSVGVVPVFNNDGAFIKISSRQDVLKWDFVNNGLVDITAGDLVISEAAFTQNSGETRLSGGRIIGDPIQIRGGQLTGFGQISSPVSNNGRIAPGSPTSARTMEFNGLVTLGTSSVVSFKLGGRAQGTEYDFISIPPWGLDLNGQLALNFINGFQNSVTASDRFTLLQACCQLRGSFNNVPSGSDLATADGFGRFTVYYGVDSPFPSNQVVITNFRP